MLDVPQLHALKVLLQGPPKVGKTTTVGRLVGGLLTRGARVGGFLTRELREHDRRVGFAVRDLDGREAVIAHQDFTMDIRVGRFGVDVAAFETIGLPALTRAMDDEAIIVIDEIARMELASADFVKLLLMVMEQPRTIVATVHVHDHP